MSDNVLYFYFNYFIQSLMILQHNHNLEQKHSGTLLFSKTLDPKFTITSN